MNENIEIRCTHCGVLIEDDDYSLINGEPICSDCVDDYCRICDECGSLIYADDAYGDENRCICQSCYDRYYTRCEDCDCLVPNDDVYNYEGITLCCDCYNDRSRIIHEYSYKPTPIFYGHGKRYFGVELEVDKGGHESDYAEEVLDIANNTAQHIYIKSDGSLDDGFEIVSHPMSLEFHQDFNWNEIMQKCVHLGYRSHMTSTCGLHIHVNRDSLGDSYDRQEETISRILYFIETHWAEILKFSRRSECNMSRWAARYGCESTPKKLLNKAKETYGRYTAVNLNNRHTVEFRMFRGTLKLNTFIAALQMVNRICDAAFNLSDEEMQNLSWSDFVANITESELIQYLKERRLYVNELVEVGEEV